MGKTQRDLADFVQPLDLVVLEGWCVGSVADSGAALMRCVNALERERDPSGDWRRYANDRLNSDYASLFSELDALVLNFSLRFGGRTGRLSRVPTDEAFSEKHGQVNRVPVIGLIQEQSFGEW